jgi:hypothetical protein
MKYHVEGAKLADGLTKLCSASIDFMKSMEEYNPSLMNMIRQYLKDNNVTVDSRSGTAMDQLGSDFKTLPFNDEEETPIEKQL